MKISLNTFLPFKGIDYNWRVYAHDDSISKERRQDIRKHLENNGLALLRDEKDEYIRLVDPSHKIEKVKEIEKTEDKLDKDFLYKFCEEFEENCFRGAVVFSLFKALKKAGIQKIIAINPNKTDKDKADEIGIEYYSCNIFNQGSALGKNLPFQLKKEYLKEIEEDSRDKGLSQTEIQAVLENASEYFDYRLNGFVKNSLIPFIEKMRERNFYMGCDYGTYRTDLAVSLNSWFNPKADYNFIFPTSEYDLAAFKNLFENLNKKHKKALGITKDFEKQFKAKLKEGFACHYNDEFDDNAN